MSIRSSITREAKFLFKQRHLLALFIVVLCLSCFAVWSGISETNSQRATIERLLEKDTIDRENVLAKQSDYGAAAYYSFHLTYSSPSSLAFAAIGQRDVSPWKHRIRMLALEGQIYETDADNPELSFLGRFDFAFLVSVLLPLFVILLLHDLRSSEREAGRYDLLITTAKQSQSLWLSRAAVLSIALTIALLLPFTVGAIYTQAPLASMGLMLLVVIGHVLFWMLLTLWLTASQYSAKKSSAKIASTLLSIWLVVTVLVPVSSDLAIKEMVSSPKGGDILMTQREAVNDAWDLPYSATWEAFLSTHPQWKNGTQMGGAFEWKWYYAFQQVGDQKANALSTAYRDATTAKDKLANLFALASPPMLTQRVMSAIAETDTQAAMQYEQDIRDYHHALRQFYYPLFFNRTTFSLATMAELPQFSTYKNHLPSHSIKIKKEKS